MIISGDTSFVRLSEGSTARDAFENAVTEDRDKYGSKDSTGTLADKDSFINMKLPAGEDPMDFAKNMFERLDRRCSDKDGPCACIDITGSTHALMYLNDKGIKNKKVYMFFGMSG
tara:strand:- start:311 stop:655 length:345 start_codon:yes stop_codon:yes gene_type:complete